MTAFGQRRQCERSTLAVGDTAWCLVTEILNARSRSGARSIVRGAARVQIEAIDGDVFHVIVLCASGARSGERVRCSRPALYAVRGAEHRAFGELLPSVWGGR